MAQSRTKRKPFHVSILEKIVRTSPTNEFMLAADLRVTVPSVKRVVDTLVRQGDVERIEVPGYTPHLAITPQGREYLREREPGWWKTASRDVRIQEGREPRHARNRAGTSGFSPARRLNNGREIRRVDGQVAAPAAAPPRAGSPVAPRSTAPGPRKRS